MFRMGRPRNWPGLRSRIYLKNPRYTSCSNYWPHQLIKVWKHWVQNCGCDRVSKLLNCVLRWRHLTWPGNLTIYDLGSKFLHKMRKGRMNRYAKFGGAARRHFSGICETPMGVHMCPPAVCGLTRHCTAWGGVGSDPPRFFRNNFFIYYCIDMKLGTPLRASIWRRLVQRKSKSAWHFLL